MRNTKTLKRQSGSGRKKLNTLKQTNRKHSRDVRSFTVLSINGSGNKSLNDKDVHGRFLATTPKAAASKAFSRWCRDNGKQGKCTATITVFETTRGNQHKKYSYNALRRTHEKQVKYKGKTRSQDVILDIKYVNQLYTTKNVKELSPGSPVKKLSSKGGSRKNNKNKSNNNTKNNKNKSNNTNNNKNNSNNNTNNNKNKSSNNTRNNKK